MFICDRKWRRRGDGGKGVIQRRKIKWAICKFSISRIFLNQSLREKKKWRHRFFSFYWIMRLHDLFEFANKHSVMLVSYQPFSQFFTTLLSFLFSLFLLFICVFSPSCDDTHIIFSPLLISFSRRKMGFESNLILSFLSPIFSNSIRSLRQTLGP